MKNLCLYSWLVLLFTFSGFAQNENNNWQLGTTKLTFSTNPPTVSTVSNSGQHGNASISDINGNLLFYTNGITVWNKNHQIMTNGGSNGNQLFLHQPVIILPLPNNINKYYIFYAISENDLAIPAHEYHEYAYSIVDFTSNSLGQLVDFGGGNYTSKLPNDTSWFIHGTGYYGPLTVAKNNSNDGYWVIMHEDNKIFSFALTSSGLNLTPVVSSYTQPSGKINHIFKMSPDNTKLGFLENDDAYSSNSIFYTFNFNSTTGQFTNQTLITVTSPNFGAYNFDFSSDSQKLYFSKSNLFVKDLANLSTPARYLISSDTETLNQMQRDINGNILLSSSSKPLFSSTIGSNNIRKIENQNSFSSSTVVSNFVTLNSLLQEPNCLPQLIPSIIGSCATNVTVISNVATGIDKKQASSTIIASNKVSSNANAIYHAGTSVVLTNGFYGESNSKFRGYIEGCTGVFVGRNSGENESNEEDSTILSKEKLILYPNPTNSLVTISVRGSKIKDLKINSLDGKLVFNISAVNESAKEINISALSKAIYILTIETYEGKIMTEKLVKN